MKKVTLMFLSLILVSAVFSQINAQVLFNENFNYPVGTKLVDTGYVNNTGTGNIQTVVTGNLTYTGYPSSNIGGMISVAGGSGSREDVYRTFEKVSSGALYTSFLVKVDTASKGDYFFHFFYKYGSTSTYNARTYVKGNGDGTFKFGISKAKADTAYTTNNYKYGTTYLIVVKYEYLTTLSANDDKVSLFVNPDLTLAEPTTPDLEKIAPSKEANSDSPLNAIGIRQGGDVYTLNMDGIVVATSWGKINTAPVAPVTFQANMRVQILEKSFTVGTDKVVVRGDFQKAAGDPGNDWDGTYFELKDADGDSIYTVTADFPVDKINTVYNYKVVARDWENNVSNRPFTVKSPNVILGPVYWDNDSVVTVVPPSPYTGKKFKVTFTADISSIYNNGFDPNKDSLLVMGLDWDGLGKDVIGSRKMTEGLTPGVFETTLQVTALKDSATYKLRLFPTSAFGDDGWEQIPAPNRYLFFKDFGDKDSMAVPTITPKFLILQPGITKDITVLFQVNMTGAKNKYDNSEIPLADIGFVGLKGKDSVLGAWQNDTWAVSDTTNKYMVVLNDKGYFGDKKAGDNIWSREVVYKAGTPSGSRPFKYGVWYTGADTHTGGNASVLDNEAPYGQNHYFELKDEPSGRIELLANWGNMTTGVKELSDSKKIPTEYQLVQNYPNPFNPATTIRYSVPKAGIVTLKIYNMLGQEVATLINAQQNAGNYEVSFDASRLSSGIYLYNLTSGSFSSTKKMMLVK